jgi:cytochrome b561
MSAARWPLSIRLFHWVSAAAILTLLALGFVMVNLVEAPGRRFELYQLHKSLGLFVLALTLVRIGGRLARTAPAPIATIALWQERAARTMHGALYGLILALALAGYAMVSTSPLPVALPFGLHAPNLLAPDEALYRGFKQAHHLLAAILAFCIAGHVAAALKHHFVDRDNTLRRMALFSAERARSAIERDSARRNVKPP